MSLGNRVPPVKITIIIRNSYDFLSVVSTVSMKALRGSELHKQFSKKSEHKF